VAADFDGDVELDIAAVSCYNLWERPSSQSIVWQENNGKMNFTGHEMSHSPTHPISLETAEMNGDRKPDLVTVSMDADQPLTNGGRVVLWINQRGQTKIGRIFPPPLARLLWRLAP